MPPDDDDDDDLAGSAPPPPADDRLWRHPSELSPWSSSRVAPTGAGAADRIATWPTMLVAAALGATLCGTALAMTGHLATADPEHVVEKVAMTPVVSSPMVRGGSGTDALVEVVGPAVAQLVVSSDAATTRASGVVVRSDGLIFTSAHEVADATSIEVVLADGRRFDGELVGADLPTDVAVVTIDAAHLAVAVLGTSARLDTGVPTMVMGASDDGPGHPAVATGVVSALERRLDADGESLHGLIQTDEPTEASWAGGPLLDATGSVIGITTGLGGEGLRFGYATPIDLVRQVADELMASGTVTHPWLGIEGVDLDEVAMRELGLTGGVRVRAVADPGPAAQSGLAPEDVITDVGGQPVRSSSGLVVAMRRLHAGDDVVVGYWREGDRQEAVVTIGRRP